MEAQLWPKELDHIWAKSADKGESNQPETLAQHTWLVLSRLADFAKLRAELPTQLQVPNLWHCLYWGGFLHDFGKAVPPFQGILRKSERYKQIWAGHRHEVFSLPFLDWVVDGLTEQDRLWVVAAIASHHRTVKEIQRCYPNPADEMINKQLIDFQASDVYKLHIWLKDFGWAWAKELGFDVLGVKPVGIVEEIDPAKFLANFGKRAQKYLVLYDLFISRMEGKHKPELFVPLIALRGTLMNSDHSASAHLASLPILKFSSYNVLEQQGVARDRLYTHQEMAEKTQGSVLLIAPTGSGKTEAALLWASGQLTKDKAVPRIFYTLPYQASMNAMVIRLRKTFGKEFVSLQHGRSLLALYRELMETDDSPTTARKKALLARDLNKLNYPPVRVFSPYQILKGMYRLKGYEAQLTDYHNGLFIFDEIHAYETKRLALILKSIEYLRKYYHARFFVMSATFPSLIKSWLKNALGDVPEIIATPELFQEFQRHQINIIQGDLFDKPNLEKIMLDARSGKSVLVVCNVIAKAQEAYNQLLFLQNEGLEIILLHGRFNLRDRLEKEKLVRKYTGVKDETGKPNPNRKPIILIATQVVEVSLDIDLDTIYTQPAPLEALVQRFGRINRARLRKIAVVNVFTKPDDGQGIYNEKLVQGTLQILERENGNELNERKVGEWLDEIYNDEISQLWEKEFNAETKNFQESIIDILRPFGMEESNEEAFYKAFDGVEVLPESLNHEYMQLKDTEPIQSNELLVSIGFKRYQMLKNSNLIFPGDEKTPIIVKTAYNKDTGLSFEPNYKFEDD